MAQVGGRIGWLLIGLLWVAWWAAALAAVYPPLQALEEQRTSAVYRHRLEQGWRLFVPRMHRNKLPQEWHEDIRFANEVLAQFVQEMHDGKLPCWLVRHSVLAVQTFHHHLRMKISRPWDALRGWKKELTLRSRRPIPELLFEGIFAEGLMYGLAHRKMAVYYIVGVILFRVGFEALLRPAEILRLQAGDVKIVTFNGVKSAVLAIRDPKNYAAFGAYQFARVTNPVVASWLEWLISGLPSRAKLWPSSRLRLVRVWNHLLERLEMLHLHLTLGSLRPGKATAMILAGEHPATVQFAGRWASQTPFHVYVQEASAMLVWTALPGGFEIELRSSLKVAQHLLASRPQVPWHSIFDRKVQWLGLMHGWKKSARGLTFSRQ